MQRAHVAAVGLLLLAAGESIGAQVNHAERRAELLRQDRDAEARARSGNFVEVLSELFAPQGVYLTSGAELARGPTGARAWLSRDSLNARSTAQWTVLRHDVSADGRDGYTYGYFDTIRSAGDTLLGRYHAYWRRSDDGRWQLLAFTRARRGSGAKTLELPDQIARAATYRAAAERDSVKALLDIVHTEGAFADSVGVDVAAAFSGFAAPDAAKAGSEGKFLFGPEAIYSLFAKREPAQLGPAWRPEWGSIAASYDLGFTLGPAWPRHAGAIQAPPAEPTGRYFTIWKRQPNGTWRYLVD